MLERQYAAWNHWLIGYDCWPYNEIKVNIVGFAVKEASLLDWTDDSLGTITVGSLDSDGVPQCDQSCYRFYDNGPGSWSDTSSCKGEPFDISLWPKQGLEGGFGYDWGQEVNLENMLSTIDEDQLVIVAHEIGHGFGLPDFYETEDKPNDQWPNCIMMAGSSMTEGSDATQTSTNSTSTGDHATFGTVTSKSGECVIGNPNKYVSTADIDWIWKNRIGPDAPTREANWNVMDNKNWIMDHIVKNKGSLNYCVRWDSTEKLSKTVASKFKAMLERQ
ncbi:Neutral zinc metallopeptidase, Zn-binding site, partial [Phytophthora palmivora]